MAFPWIMVAMAIADDIKKRQAYGEATGDWSLKGAWNPFKLGGGEIPLPESTMSQEDIDKLIGAYRKSGLEGIRNLGQQEAQGASARIASSGIERTPAMEQGVYGGIMEKLAGARAGLEGSLAGTEMQGLQYSGNQDFMAQMQRWANSQSQGAASSDMANLMMMYYGNKLGGSGGGMTGSSGGGWDSGASMPGTEAESYYRYLASMGK